MNELLPSLGVRAACRRSHKHRLAGVILTSVNKSLKKSHSKGHRQADVYESGGKPHALPNLVKAFYAYVFLNIVFATALILFNLIAQTGKITMQVLPQIIMKGLKCLFAQCLRSRRNIRRDHQSRDVP